MGMRLPLALVSCTKAAGQNFDEAGVKGQGAAGALLVLRARQRTHNCFPCKRAGVAGAGTGLCNHGQRFGGSCYKC
jgi:hypothetical protein